MPLLSLLGLKSSKLYHVFPRTTLFCISKGNLGFLYLRASYIIFVCVDLFSSMGGEKNTEKVSRILKIKQL
jgi:hypothetical protein